MRGEHALLWPRRVATRMYAQHTPPCAVEPCQDDDRLPRVNAIESRGHPRFEDEPGARRPLVALVRRGGDVGQIGLDDADRPERDRRRAHVDSPLTLDEPRLDFGEERL